MKRILILHPRVDFRSILSSMLFDPGYQLDEAQNEVSGLQILKQRCYDLIIVGFDDIASRGSRFLELLRSKYSTTPILVACRQEDRVILEAAIRVGAHSVIFPAQAETLRKAVLFAMVRRSVAFGTESPFVADRHLPEPSRIPRSGHTRNVESGSLCAGESDPLFVGQHYAIRHIVDFVKTLAGLPLPFLVVGESGTGKRLVTQLLARSISDACLPVVEYDCDQSHEKSFETDFLGSSQDMVDRNGLLSRSAGGILCLRNIWALSKAGQAVLLEHVQRSLLARHCAHDSDPTAVRLILVSNRELATQVDCGLFNPELFYALGIVELRLPPLRYRGEDIPRLAAHFLQKYTRLHQKAILGFCPSALERLSSYQWPGNVAELELVVEQAVIACTGMIIQIADIGLSSSSSCAGALQAKVGNSLNLLPLKTAIAVPEKRLILEALRAMNWNRQEVARALELDRTTLHKKMKKYGIGSDELS